MSPDPRIGRMIADRYQLEERLGRGGMGVVYRGSHTWTERPVAVKLLQPKLASDPETLQRFFQEAKAAASLRHPHVVEVLDMGEDDDGAAFLVLELLEGEPLDARLDRDGALGADDALAVLVPVMEALEAAHEKGVIHRDLKPGNVYLAQGYKGALVPKLLDFGVAKLLEGGSVSTVTGSVIGTPTYMAPEQVRGEKDLGPPADVWGMGALWFRCLTGTLPVKEDPNPTAVLVEIIGSPRPTVASVRPDAPPSLAAAIDRALLRDRADRYPTMGAFLSAVLDGARADGLDVTQLE